MALQELDLHLHYQPEKVNKNADALSRVLVQTQPVKTTEDMELVVAALADPQATTKDREEDTTLAERQSNDRKLRPIIQYLRERILPDDKKSTRELTLNRKQYVLMDNVLYHLASDNTLRIIPPVKDRHEIIKEAHSGKLAGPLQDTKVYGQIGRTYWWAGMHKEVMQCCRACEQCASCHVGRPINPPLTPTPVKGLFDRIGVDIIKFPYSSKSNKYVHSGFHGLHDKAARSICHKRPNFCNYCRAAS